MWWIELPIESIGIGLIIGLFALYGVAILRDLLVIRATSGVQAERLERKNKKRTLWTSFGEWFSAGFEESRVRAETLEWALGAENLRTLDITALSASSPSEGFFYQRIIDFITTEFRSSACAILVGGAEQGALLIHPPFQERFEQTLRRFLMTQHCPSPETTVFRVVAKDQKSIATSLDVLGIASSLIAIHEIEGQPCTIWLGYRSETGGNEMEVSALRELSHQLLKERVKRRELEKLSRQIDEVEERHRDKEKFLAHFSHDIRSPLTTIRSVLTLLSFENGSPETQELLQSALRNCESVGELVEDLLDYVKHRSGKLEAHLQIVSLPKILHQVVDSFAIPAKLKGLSLSCSDISDEISLHVDPRHLKRILSNLVSNAIKYTDRGSVTLSIEKNVQGRVQIVVQDTGVGMSSVETGQLFTPFVRFLPERDGVGLGLAVTKLLVDLNGGVIEAYSEKGNGSRFILHFNGVFQSQSAPGIVQEDRESILIIEEDPRALDLLTGAFERRGMQVLRAQTSAEAIGICKLISPTLVITSYQMKSGGGRALLQFFSMQRIKTRVILRGEQADLLEAQKIYPVERNIERTVDAETLYAMVDAAMVDGLEVAKLVA